MKTSTTRLFIPKTISSLLIILGFTTHLFSNSFQECGFDLGDLSIEIGCDGTITFDLEGDTYGYSFDLFTDDYDHGDLVLGDPIIHGTLRFTPFDSFYLSITGPACFQILKDRMPNWNFKVGVGGGKWTFNPGGGLIQPAVPGTVASPAANIVQTIKPTCPMMCDGELWVELGPTDTEKCDDFVMGITVDGNTIFVGPNEIAKFKNLCSGDYTITFMYDMYSCPCTFADPEDMNATIKEPSANTTSLACINETNISADGNCKVTLDYFDVALGESDPCGPVGMMDDSIFVYGPYGALLGSGIPNMSGSGSVIFDAHHLIGEKVKVEIRDGGSDNWCWGYVYIEDKLPPVISCNDPSKREVLCLDFDQEPAQFMILHDCDKDAKATVIKEKTINDCSGRNNRYLKMIEMTYFATDKWGNKSNVCTDTLKILRFDTIPGNDKLDIPGDIILPPDYVMDPGKGDKDAIDCSDDSFVKDQNHNPAPISMAAGGTGVPLLEYENDEGQTVTTPLCPINYDTNDPDYLKKVDEMLTYCKIALTYEDFKFQFGCKTKIQRTWTLREWSCEGEQMRILGVQEIQIVDDEGPEFIEKVPDADVTVNSYNCSKYKEVKKAKAVDACDGEDESEIQVTIFDEDWNLIGPDAQTFAATHSFDFPMGLNYVVYTAFDKCHNFTRDTAIVNVLDKTPPVVVCKEFLVVGISADGTVRVPKSAFDNGSYDDCLMKETCVLRMDDLITFNQLDGPDGDGWVFLDDFNAACGRDFTHYAEQKTINGQSGLFLHRDALCTPEVHFCCSDDDPEIENDEVQVIFRATDHYGNTNECMVVVEIQDKNTPSIICPPNVEVDCELAIPGLQDLPEGFINQDDDPLSFLFGKIAGEHNQVPFGFHRDHLLDDFGNELVDGVYFDNCDENLDVFVKTEADFDQCGTGKITRTFYVQDASGNRSKECSQMIFIAQLTPLRYENIVWPVDIFNFSGCLDPDDSESLVTPKPEVPHASCTLMGMNSSDEVYSFNTDGADTSDACFKVIRTWSIIDWCQKDHTGKPVVYSHTQIIKVIDTEGPQLVNPDDPEDETWGDQGICAGPAQVFDATSCDMGRVILRNNATDSCTNDSKLKWTVKVKLHVGTPDEEIRTPSNNVDGPGALFEIDEFYPVGNHQVLWVVDDLCGNSAICVQDFTVLFNKKPTPFANELNTVLMNTTQTVEIWAEDLNNKSGHDCYDEDDLVYTIARHGEGIENSAAFLTFDCDDVGEDSIDFFVRVIGTNLYDFTTLVIKIQDNSNNCEGFTSGETASIAGNISTSRSEGVRDMGIGLATQFQGASTMLNEVTTNVSGNYAFPPMPMGGSYDVKPVSTRDYLNGVTTLDLVQIQQYIIGVGSIDSPYDQIAADVNNDDKISAIDIVNLRSVILGMEEEFSNNTSWRFVDESFVFDQGIDPLKTNFPETYQISGLETNMQIDFVGVKVGDINGTVEVESVLAGGRSRTALAVTDRTFSSGEIVRVDLKTTQKTDLLGFQWTLNFDPGVLSYEGTATQLMNFREENVGTRQLEEGVVAMSWHQAQPVDLGQGDVLVTLVFRAVNDGRLSQVMSMSSDIASSEWYRSNMEVENLDVEFEAIEAPGIAFELKQNTPNPFSTETEIVFVLPEASDVTLTVFDVTGKSVYQTSGQYDKGTQSITLDKSDLATSGVVYYTLETEYATKTKRAVILK